jgi:hypothetical protein
LRKKFENMEKDQNRPILSDCCGTKHSPCDCKPAAALQPMFLTERDDSACCGPPTDPPSGPDERPGYRIWPFVEGFLNTAAGQVPRVNTALGADDHFGGIKVCWGIRRNQYKIAPGLYCIGYPDETSPVLVTANYKLSFDILRNEARLPAAWILVLDTRGINVWCAAGKGTFSTEEVVRQVKAAHLDSIVKHRRIILPQLAATGVSAHQVKKTCGFAVVWGPIRAGDLKRFLDSGMTAETDMRRVTFTIFERLTLVPVELSLLPRYFVWIAGAVFLLSGIGIEIFSFQAAWGRSLWMAIALAGGIFAGAVLSPVLLPWIPGRSFSVKGALTGIPIGVTIGWLLREQTNGWEALALVICTTALSSVLSMNFTGSTPYTSPSGVEKEMRKAIPLQVAALFTTVILWVAAAFA